MSYLVSGNSRGIKNVMGCPCGTASKRSCCAVGDKSVYLDIFSGKRCPSPKASTISKTDVAQDGCTVLCRNPSCYNIGTHRCAACEREAYCSETCRRQDRPRHEEDCQRHAATSTCTTTTRRVEMMKQFDRQASCQGRPQCPKAVVSFCRHCQTTVCDQWKCSKFHLEQCNAYLDAKLEREWVRIDLIKKGGSSSSSGPLEEHLKMIQKKDGANEEEWVLVERGPSD